MGRILHSANRRLTSAIFKRPRNPKTSWVWKKMYRKTPPNDSSGARSGPVFRAAGQRPRKREARALALASLSARGELCGAGDPCAQRISSVPRSVTKLAVCDKSNRPGGFEPQTTVAVSSAVLLLTVSGAADGGVRIVLSFRYRRSLTLCDVSFGFRRARHAPALPGAAMVSRVRGRHG